MFVVFFQGTSDRDVILRGMGIALITTLLGLVVSIILNLSATELSTAFDKRLDRIAKKSDELRFRLLELVAARDATSTEAREAPRESSPVERAAASDRSAERPAATPPAASNAAARPEPARPEWVYFESEPAGYVAKAGEALGDLEVRVRADGGRPVPGVAVRIALPPDAGAFADGGRELRQATNVGGVVRFGWQAPTRAGTYASAGRRRPAPARIT
jgi:hypothetical protein